MRAEYSAAAGGVILVARFAAGAVLNYAFGIALAWLLVPSQFGTVSAVQNVLLLAAGIVTGHLVMAVFGGIVLLAVGNACVQVIRARRRRRGETGDG